MSTRLPFSTSYRSLLRVGTYLIILAILASSIPMAQVYASAYIEPGLVESEAQTVSVIVAGRDAGQAARMIQRAEGTVTNDLWIIDSVAAQIPTENIYWLARQPGIRSIVANRGVHSADAGFDGWVNRRRISDGTRDLAGKLVNAPVPLPDGGLVVMTDEGKLQIFNANGSERQRIRLPKGDYSRSPSGRQHRYYLRSR